MATKHLVWLRNDLRLEDNPALYLASQQGDIRVVITATPEQWIAHNESPAKTGLRAAFITTLGHALAAQGIPLDILEVDTFQSVAPALEKFCLAEGVRHIWFNQDIPPHELQRDNSVKQTLQSHDIQVNKLASDLFVPQDVLSQQGTPFKVFTPFFKRWSMLLSSQEHSPYPAPSKQAEALNFSWSPPSWVRSAAPSFREDLWPADYDIIRQRLWHFCHTKEEHYDNDRNYPIKPATSTLSPYLALGALGPRQCLEAIHYVCEQNDRLWQESIWLKELAWRDFYRQLMGHFSFLAKHRPFKAETDKIQWRDNQAEFEAWCEGRTGFPIVDAAMRQLNQTGWMHNRLRMISASFFTKLLFADWRKGEAYFMSKLIDGEFAANNGGWQWSASTGCDAAPYFRVFNPTRQSETYDKDGDFIRRFVPELEPLEAKAIHNPSSEQRARCAYPEPIIDYKPARAQAIDAFSALNK
ncbi:cryptochrome/photolyase family protein [Marinomonas transparens]|uniref:Deoxyribodipyrimidine photo-lyase n=1 Tax=Marinomonas transparens TaxID=2795388 RepID=A0A934JNM7_9GAMM|nr:FAD-binding domain-containing protein [Marinomonas transparens]MBJ7536868.1 deoxyribodipyrimidine photo-lyase [Marinomonas transparens]